MDDFFIKVEQQLRNNLPFAIYNKPNSDKLIGFFQNDAELHLVSDFTEVGFIFAPFQGKEVVIIPKSQSEIIISHWSHHEQNAHIHPHSLALPFEKLAFENLVAKGIIAIEMGKFQKVVLSRKEDIALPYFDLSTIFNELLNAYPTAFTYCFYHPKIGMWMGASPEQLVKVKTNQFETIALAGTQKFDGEDNVLWENKEKEEQQIVTDFILENLENVTSDIAFSSPYTYKAGNLLHIKTDISGVLNDPSNVKQLVEILHPTPAVCGLPKEKARDFILQHEGYDRKYYSGYLGELHANFNSDLVTTDLFVNLRCMEITNNIASLYIGCGVTKDSNPELEFIETVNKSMTIKKILN